MNGSAIAFFLVFAVILWGGLAWCLKIALSKKK